MHVAIETTMLMKALYCNLRHTAKYTDIKLLLFTLKKVIMALTSTFINILIQGRHKNVNKRFQLTKASCVFDQICRELLVAQEVCHKRCVACDLEYTFCVQVDIQNLT